ncbi:Oxygen-independent coproporphyrinogen-III oxidase-like protein [Poriferisphaera corsica]|uniref:Heme chaperone HemW n=1 Tax=Poriferisphaera corsica TaxID=2528020 RepID=A0A517YU28_9BACT|nr:radical SAM family heme chaperone HemW [Poriferisphaera corsica]QDU33717.1 Oxygen-independent coproporphyrinogen-III oxidase-like protein [Poriferisphaera corsica]
MQQPKQVISGHRVTLFQPTQNALGLYLHIPFCFHKCHYCDFYSIVDSDLQHKSRQKHFTDALCCELLAANDQSPLPVRTIFVGGGTPTLLKPHFWQKILETLHKILDFDLIDEFTVEANPETVTPELMRLFSSQGVNRISIGAQSFDTSLLKVLERWHDPQNVLKAIDTARDAGIHNINLDMIFAIPSQTLTRLESDLSAVLALQPDHISDYSLIFEPNTPLTQKRNMGLIAPLPEDAERDMYQLVIDRLTSAGYDHYEISNYAKSSNNPDLPAWGNQCLHNLLYWHNANWLGFGPAAASHMNGHRWKNLPHLGKYIEGSPTPPTTDHEYLSRRDRLGEALMLGLRLRQGVPITWIDSNIPSTDPRHQTIAELKQINMLEVRDQSLRLTDQGLFVADAVIAKLL